MTATRLQPAPARGRALMGDGSTVLLAVAACAGAWAARSLPLWPALVLMVVALALHRPVLLMVAVALAASALGFRAWEGLHPPAVGTW